MSHRAVAHTDPFILGRTGLIPVRSITYVDLSDLDGLRIKVHHGGGVETLTEIQAVEALLVLKPSALEGRRMRWARNAWLVHNTVGHVSLQFMASAAGLVRPFAPKLAKALVRSGIYVHDATCPKAGKLAL